MVVDEEGREGAAERKARAEDALWPVRTAWPERGTSTDLPFLEQLLMSIRDQTPRGKIRADLLLCTLSRSTRKSLRHIDHVLLLHNHLFACSSLDNELIHNTPTVRMALASKSHGGQLSLRTHPRISCQGWACRVMLLMIVSHAYKLNSTLY